MIYIKATNPSQAKLLSERLYKLSRPNPNPEDITTCLVSWITHPTTGDVMVCLPDGVDLPVSPLSDPKILATLLAPFVAAGKIATGDVDSIETKLMAAKGERIALLDILPSFWTDQQQTYDQLKESGWFPDLYEK